MTTDTTISGQGGSGSAAAERLPHNVTVVERLDGKSSSVEILHYNGLKGSDDISIAQTLFFAEQVGLRLKQVRITLRNGEAVLESGALHFMKGNITAETSVGGLGGFAKKLVTSALTNETTFRPRYRGTGEIYTEPTFGHFLVINLVNEEAIVERSMYYASEGSVELGVAVQKNVSSALFGGEGLIQTRVYGTGWCVLTCPVPASEVVRYQLNNEKLSVDGTFALLRKGKIDFRVEKSTKSLIGTATSGEGLLQTFTGTGEVWLAPTQSVYARLKAHGLGALAQSKGTSNNP